MRQVLLYSSTTVSNGLMKFVLLTLKRITLSIYWSGVPTRWFCFRYRMVSHSCPNFLPLHRSPPHPAGDPPFAAHKCRCRLKPFRRMKQLWNYSGRFFVFAARQLTTERTRTFGTASCSCSPRLRPTSWETMS